MGGTLIKESNDDMVDDLISTLYLKTGKVEKVLRTVDRAFYYLPKFRHLAYSDEAWKRGNLHLSSPRIYSRVLQHLDLQPGLSFLNIGSGTGYLSTMAGLLLGPYGVNHGIEIQPDVVDYAYEKLEQFKTTCSGVDVFEFCEPYFIVGNVFDLSHARKYDRIYCGAACPEIYHEHIKKYMKIGGILIMPCGDDLLKVVRNSETSWEEHALIPVSFSTLEMAGKTSSNMISMPDPNPLSLQELCRSTIRIVLRADSSSSSDNYSPYESMTEMKSKNVEATLSWKDSDGYEIFTKGGKRSFYNLANDLLPTFSTIEKAQESRYNESNNKDVKDEISEYSLEVESGCDSLRSNDKSTSSSNNEHDLQRSYEPNQNIRKQADDGNDDENDHPEKLLKREKLNSGISDFAPATDTLPFKYRKAMEAKIQALPLPQSLKLYLNHNRPFEFS